MHIVNASSYAREVPALGVDVEVGETIVAPDDIALTLLEQGHVWLTREDFAALGELVDAGLSIDDIATLAASSDAEADSEPTPRRASTPRRTPSSSTADQSADDVKPPADASVDGPPA